MTVRTHNESLRGIKRTFEAGLCLVVHVEGWRGVLMHVDDACCVLTNDKLGLPTLWHHGDTCCVLMHVYGRRCRFACVGWCCLLMKDDAW